MLRSRYGIFILLYTLCIQLENASSEPIFKFVMKLDKIVLPDSYTKDTSCTDFDFILIFNKGSEELDTYKIDYWTLKHTILTFEPKIFQHNLLKGEYFVLMEMLYKTDHSDHNSISLIYLHNFEGDMNLDCNPCMNLKIESISLYAKISLKNINKAETYRIVTIIYYDIMMKNALKYNSFQPANYDNKDENIYMLNINSLTMFTSNLSIIGCNLLFLTFLKSDKFNELKDGMKLHILVMLGYEETKSIFWERNIEYNLSDSNNIRNMFDKELTDNGISARFKIETFSTNYGGKNFQYLCKFENKNTICDENGKKICVRKYIKNHENCEKVDPCEVNPCKNNAICKSFSTNYECHCTIGYYGKMCESMLCNKNCIKRKAPYICEECKLGLIGDNCTIKTCQGYDCGKGDCQRINNIRSCKCKNEYFGEKCSDTCFRGCNNGYCELYNGYVRCQCDLDYSGLNCLQKENFNGSVFLKSTKFINNLMIITIIIVILIIIFFFTLIITKPKVTKVLTNSNAKHIYDSPSSEKVYSEHSAYPASKTDRIYDEETEKEQNHLYENIQIYEDQKILKQEGTPI